MSLRQTLLSATVACGVCGVLLTVRAQEDVRQERAAEVRADAGEGLAEREERFERAEREREGDRDRRVRAEHREFEESIGALRHEAAELRENGHASEAEEVEREIERRVRGFQLEIEIQRHRQHIAELREAGQADRAEAVERELRELLERAAANEREGQRERGRPEHDARAEHAQEGLELLHQAVRHLHEAGFHEPAEQLERQTHELAQHIDRTLHERARHADREHASHHAEERFHHLEARVEDLSNQLREIHETLRDLVEERERRDDNE